MIDTILFDIWDSLDLLITSAIITLTVLSNMFFCFRFVFMLQSRKDPIQAFKKEASSSTLVDSLMNEKQYNEINRA